MRNRKLIPTLLCAVLAAAPIACSTGQPAWRDWAPSPLEQRMYTHFNEALELRAGSIFGSMNRIKEAASSLAEFSSASSLPSGSEEYAEQLKEAARAALRATEPATARRAAADVARACGSCHEPYGVGPEFGVGAPQAGETLGRHMGRQSRISRLLWDGLIGPSDATWTAGAAELVAEPRFPIEIASRVPDPGLLDRARADLIALGEEAEKTTDPEARSEILARVWGVCAGCHTVAEMPGPDR